MINRIQIKNFQSHKESDLQLHPGVNVIVGTSDSGKTAVLRALKWLVWNRPGGDSFRSTWGGKTEVIIHTEDEHGISRTKDKGVNQYAMDTEIFNAFGTDVPKEIKDVLNISDINLQQQMDSPFLLTSSPGEVAKHFNKIAHLDQIDTGLQKLQKWIRDETTTKKYVVEGMVQLRESIAKLDYLDSMEVDMEALEQAQNWLYSLKQAIIALITWEGEYNANQIKIKKHREVLAIEPEVIAIEEKYKEKVTKLDILAKLTLIIFQIKSTQKEIESWQPYVEIEKEVDEIESMVLRMNNKKDDMKDLMHTIGDIKENLFDLEITKVSLITCEKEFKDKFPNVCPLCNTKLK